MPRVPPPPTPQDVRAADDLRDFARFVGRPFPSAREVAAELDISVSRAFKLLARIKDRGVAREVAVLNLQPGCCHTVTLLFARLETPDAMPALERRLVEDPAVQSVSRVSGSSQYRVQALHGDARAANAWFRAVLEDPAVADGQQQFVRILFRSDG